MKTIWIDDKLHKALKLRAVEKGVKLQDLINKYLAYHFESNLKAKLKGKQRKIGDILNDGI